MTTTLRHPSASPPISLELENRLASQITAENPDIDRPTAHRIIRNTVAFLQACADNPGQPLRPSRMVDIGWHTFILNTRDYAAFCHQIAGRFIHHQPEEYQPPASPVETLEPTIQAIKKAGLEADTELWAAGTARCSQCHAGCTSCGQGDGHH